MKIFRSIQGTQSHKHNGFFIEKKLVFALFYLSPIRLCDLCVAFNLSNLSASHFFLNSLFVSSFFLCSPTLLAITLVLLLYCVSSFLLLHRAYCTAPYEWLLRIQLLQNNVLLAHFFEANSLVALSLLFFTRLVSLPALFCIFS